MANSFDYLINIVARFSGAAEVKQDLRDVSKGIQDFGTFSQKNAKGIEQAVKGINSSIGKVGKEPIDTKITQQAKAIYAAFDNAGVPIEKIDKTFKEFNLEGKNIAFTTAQVGKFNASLKASGASSQQINDINKNLKEMGVIAPKTAGGVNDFEKALRRAAIVAPVWMALRAAMQAVMSLIRDQVKFLIDLESAMARIRIVGKGTEEEFTNLKNSLVALSFVYGTASSKALDAAVIFAQQGKSVSETIELTQQAMLASIVLGKDIKTVTEDMTAAMNSYGIASKNSLSIIDKWIGVEKEFAVTSKDLADATKVTGATAKQVGVSIDALLGDVTAVIEVTRKSGSEAARGLQFIYARLLTSAKPVIQSLANIKFYLDENGKATNALTGTLRPATDILDELAAKWSSLTNEQQLQIASATGSKRQLVVMNALMINHNRSIDARITALTSAGQAERAFNIEQDTTAFKLEQLTAAWNNLANALGDTGAFKVAIDSMNQLVLSLVYLVDAEKAYNVIAQKIATQEKLRINKQKQLIDSYDELIKMRDKFLKEPPSDENTKRIEALNRTIQEVLDKNEVLDLAIKMHLPKENIDNIKKQISEDLSREDIEIAVKAEFAPKIAALKPDLFKEVISGTSLLDVATGKVFVNAYNAAKKIPKNQKEILELEQKQNEEIEKRIQEQKDTVIIQEGLVALSKELGDEDEERLQIERQLSNLNILESDNIEKRIQKEIELIRNSQYQVKDEEKILKLEELQNKLTEARLKFRKKETEEARNLIFQLEQADFIERQKIKRQLELQAMPEGRVVQAFRESERDRALILKNISDYSENVQNQIAQIISRKFGVRFQPFALKQTEKQFTPTEGISPAKLEPFIALSDAIKKFLPFESLTDTLKKEMIDFKAINRITPEFKADINTTVNIPIDIIANLKDMQEKTMAKVNFELEQKLTETIKKIGTQLNKAIRSANDYGGEEQP
jgi:TP901 family phage tail tape measure protein